MKTDWLDIARSLQSIAQSGLTYTKNQYDVERYNQLLEIAATIVGNSSTLSVDQAKADFSNQQGYLTPKIDIRGAVLNNNKILLVKEAQDGRWCLPDGWADVGESPSEAIAREVFEESGLKVVVKSVIGVYDANKDGRELSLYHVYKIVFLCEKIDGKLTPSMEITAVDFFEKDALPELSSSRTNISHLNDVFEFVENTNTPVKFD